MSLRIYFILLIIVIIDIGYGAKINKPFKGSDILNEVPLIDG